MYCNSVTTSMSQGVALQCPLLFDVNVVRTRKLQDNGRLNSVVNRLHTETLSNVLHTILYLLVM